MPYWKVMTLISEAVKKAFTGEDKEENFDGDCRREKDDADL